MAQEGIDQNHQVTRIVDEIAKLTEALSTYVQVRERPDPANLQGPGSEQDGVPQQPDAGAVQRPNPKTLDPLPDPRLVRKIIRQRQMRSQHFGSNLFADPVWDMLLDLAAARAEHRLVSVTSLCIASGVPTTTALRYIKILEDMGLIERTADARDRRRRFVTLSEKGMAAMARYFAEIGTPAQAHL